MSVKVVVFYFPSNNVVTPDACWTKMDCDNLTAMTKDISKNIVEYWENLEAVIEAKRIKCEDGSGRWQCVDCGQTGARKIDITRHVESKHLGSSMQVKCDVCQTVCKNRHALQRHILMYHKK